jgi:hypothetical protein
VVDVAPKAFVAVIAAVIAIADLLDDEISWRARRAGAIAKTPPSV